MSPADISPMQFFLLAIVIFIALCVFLIVGLTRAIRRDEPKYRAALAQQATVREAITRWAYEQDRQPEKGK